MCVHYVRRKHLSATESSLLPSMPQNHLAVCIGTERFDFLPITQHIEVSLHMET